MSEGKGADILDVSIELFNKEEVLSLCQTWLYSSELHQIVTVNPEFLMESRRNHEFFNVLQKAQLRIADGFGLVLISRILYGKQGRLFRMTGVDLVYLLSDLCAQNGKSVYLMGGDPEVAGRAARALQKKYPSLIISGAEEGLPKQGGGSDDGLCQRIFAAQTDVLFVALGAPRQDLWIARNKEKLHGVSIAVGVGGTFDYLAGTVPYAPRIVRSLGLEWLFRLITQPHRLNRIFTAVIRFPIAVLFWRLKK